MRKIKVLILAIVAVFAVSVPAAAQLRFGLKAGVAVNDLKLSDGANELFSAENRAGFTGGAMLEFTVPVVGIGFDASVMYVHRSTGLKFADQVNVDNSSNPRDYIDIPLNLKYKFSLPVVGSFVKPYLMTGPSFAFLVGDKSKVWDNKTFDVSWNVGFGLEFLSHLQVSASYGWGMNKVWDGLKISDNTGIQSKSIDGKNKYWTVTAAYLF